MSPRLAYVAWTRWLLVVPAALFAFCVVFWLGTHAYGFVEQHYCNPQHYWNDMCYDGSADVAIGYLYLACATIAPLVVGLAAVAMAPSRKLAVAWTAWAAGSALLLSMVVEQGPRNEVLAAGLSGLVGVLAITAYLRLRSTPAASNSSGRCPEGMP